MWTVTGLFDEQVLPEKLLTPNEGGTLRTSSLPLPPSPANAHGTLVVSLITCDLGVMLEITGGASATALAYIFPAACYLKLIDARTPWYHRSKLGPLACTAFGIVVLSISLFLALGKAWTPAGSATICI